MHSPSTGMLALIAIGTPANGRVVARLDLVGGRQRPLGVDLDERVQLAVERLDPLQRGLGELARGQLAAAHAGGKVDAGVNRRSLAGMVRGGCGSGAPEPTPVRRRGAASRP